MAKRSVSWGRVMWWALRRRPLVEVATRTIGAFVLVLLGSWLLLWQFGAEWVSFVLLVLIPVLVPIGFVVVVGQAGMLLDVRALKARYARVVAGFASGFVAGAIADRHHARLPR